MNLSFLSKFKSKNNYINVFILGMITAIIIFLPFVIFDKGLFLYYGDYDVQQIPFYKLAHEAVRSGATGWNWNTDLGVNFIGSYSFYLLGSPFFWITLLFPTATLPYLMAPLFVLKFGLTCVTGYAFISRFTKYKSTAIIGALLYSFCGFNIYNIFFNHFNEVVLIFPLLLIALEELVINNRRGGFALAVALCATVNYYFFFGQVIFVILYFIVRCTDKQFTITFKKFLILAIEAVIGLLLSSVLLLPAIMAITGNTRLGNTLLGYDLLVYNKPQRYGLIFSSFLFPPDIPARPNFFPETDAKWSSVSMFLPLLSISGVLAFFKGAKKHWAKLLLGICVIFAIIPGLNALFSAMNYNYYARWFYMPLLIMAMVSCIALEKYIKHMKFGLIVTACLVGAFAIIGVVPKEVDGAMKFFKLPPYPDRFWAYIAIAVVGILITCLLVVMTRQHKNFMRVAVFGICGITIVYSTFMIYTGKLAGEGYDTVATKAIYGREKLTLEDEPNQFYRIDTFDELDNLGMHWGLPTINAFHSVVPPSIMDYYDSIGGERGVASRPKPSMIGVRALNSVKYSFCAEGKNTTPLLGFDYYDTQNGYDVYKNSYYIPMGFTYDKFVTQSQLEACPKDYKDRLLLQGMLLSDEDYEKYNHLLPEFVVEKTYVEMLSEEEYFKACEQLINNAGSEFIVDKNGFSSKISVDKENLVFFSVPYDEGWSATVNGSSVPIVKANSGFMAVPVPQGNNVIHFEYHTPGLMLGIIITCITALILVAYIYFISIMRKQGKIKVRYDKYAHLRQIDNPVNLIAHEAYIRKTIKKKESTIPHKTQTDDKNT